jgi:hypothetical protein
LTFCLKDGAVNFAEWVLNVQKAFPDVADDKLIEHVQDRITMLKEADAATAPAKGEGTRACEGSCSCSDKLLYSR